MNPVPGESLREQAVAVAGALAELSVSELTWQDGSHAGITLQPRATDLPGLLVNASRGSRLLAPSIGLTIEVRSTGLAWSSTNQNQAAKFAAILNRA